MMDDFEDLPSYDGTDDNIEILLEEAAQDPGQAYLYIRIKRDQNEDALIRADVEYDEFYFDGEGEGSANCDEYSVLANGTVPQFAVMFLQLFELDESYIDAVAAAVKAYQEIKGNNN